jgi:WD40 repeat protein
VWSYTPTDNAGELNERGELELLFESATKGQLDGPDNMTTSPGGAIVIAEDGNLKSNFVKALLPNGTMINVAENLLAVQQHYLEASGKLYDPTVPDDGRSAGDGLGFSEFAGPCFSPDGEWIVTASRDGTIALWRRPTRVIARSPTPYLILDGDLGAVTQAVFDPKGQMIGAGYWDEAAVLWRLWSPDPNPPESLVAHWGKERARLALIGEASRYLQELGGLSPGAPVGREARGGDKTSAGSQ